MITKYRTRTARAIGGAAVAGALLFAAACGGSDSGGDTKTRTGDQSAAMAEYTACLKENGVTLPNGGGGGGGQGGPGGTPPTGRPSGQPTGRPSGQPSGRPSMSAEQQKAMEACASLRPQGGFGGQGGPGGGQGGQPSAQPTG